MFATEELGRHHVLIDEWKKAAKGSLPTVTAIRNACQSHLEKQRQAQLGVVYVGDKNPELGKASRAQSEYPPESPEHEAAEQVIAAWLAHERKNAPGERHQARMTSLYVDVRDDGCGWNQPHETNKNDAFQTVNHAMGGYGVRKFTVLTPGVLKVKDPELSAALEAWDDKPELVHLPLFLMDSEEIYR